MATDLELLLDTIRPPAKAAQIVPSLGPGGPLATTPGARPPAPTGQLVPSGGGPRPMKNVTGTATTVRPTSLPGPSGGLAKPSVAGRLASGLIKGGVIGALATPNTMGDAEVPDHLKDIDPNKLEPWQVDILRQSGNVIPPEYRESSGLSRLGDEPLNFTAPSGPSSTPSVNAELPNIQPVDAGLMGSPGVAAPAVPTSTFDVNTRPSDVPGGSVTVPTGLAEQTIQNSLDPNQPLRNVNELVSSGRAAFAEQNLADFMGNRDTPESATEQFVDPQGRLRRRDKATQELTSDYTSYEKEAAAREQRAGESFGQARGPDSRDNETGISDADYRDMAKARVRGASAGDVARGQKVADRSGVDLASGESTADEPKTAYETRLEGLDIAQREANLTKTNAQISDFISSRNPAAKPTTWSASQIGSLQDMMKENDIIMQDGKLIDTKGFNSELTEDDPEYRMIAGTDVGRAMLGLDEGGAPEVGATKSGYTFKGGDPADKNNWVKV